MKSRSRRKRWLAHAALLGCVLLPACVNLIPLKTPLTEAIESRRTDEAVALVREGAWNDRVNLARELPIHVAARLNDADVTAALLDAGMAIDAPGGRYGWTPLAAACRDGAIEVAALLLEREADPNCAGKKGVTPLHAAAGLAQEEAVRLLLDHGAKIDAASVNGETPLVWACTSRARNSARRSATVTALLEAGAAIDTGNKTGHTPLHFAASRTDGDLLGLLLARGGNLEVRSKDGMLPIHLAALARNLEGVGLLLDAGQRPEPVQESRDVGAATFEAAGDVYRTRDRLEAAVEFYRRAESEYLALAADLSGRGETAKRWELFGRLLLGMLAGEVRQRATQAYASGDFNSPYIFADTALATSSDRKTGQAKGDRLLSRARVMEELAASCRKKIDAIGTIDGSDRGVRTGKERNR